jgi:hypothetical protein
VVADGTIVGLGWKNEEKILPEQGTYFSEITLVLYGWQ